MAQLDRKGRANCALFLICSIVSTGILPLLASAEDSLPGSRPLWTHEFGAEIVSLRSLQGPMVLADIGDSLIALDKVTGVVAWGLKKNSTPGAMISQVPETDLALVMEPRIFPLHEYRTYGTTFDRGLRVTAINLNNGLSKWSTDSLGDVVSLGCITVAERNLCLLVLSDGGDKPWAVARDLQTGSVVWVQRDFFNESPPDLHRSRDGFTTLQGNPDPLMDSDSTMIVFFTRDLLQKWNFRTGQIVWSRRLDQKPEPSAVWEHGQLALNGDRQVVYVPCKKRLWAVSANDGALVWPEPPELRGMIAQVKDGPSGVLVRCRRWKQGIAQGPCITLLSHETGRRLWKRDFVKLNEYLVSDFVTHDDMCYVWSENSIYQMKIADGEFGALTHDAVLKGAETNALLFARDYGLLLVENQNALLFNYVGEPVFRTYHAKPGPTDAQIFAGALAGLAAGALLNAMIEEPFFRFYVSSALRSLDQEDPRYIWAHYRGEFLYMTVGKAGPPQEVERAGTTKMSRRIKIGPEPKPGIVKIDLRTGQTVGELPLDDDAPTYEVAPDEGLLFYLAKEDKDKKLNHRKLEAFAF